jgi:outer membrane immunogenic protein
LGGRGSKTMRRPMETSMKAIGAVAIVGMLTTASIAEAADLARPYPYVAPTFAYSWVGPYLGLTLGGQWGSVTNSSATPVGIEGGGTFGYSWQTDQFVYGVEGDLQASSASSKFAGYQFQNPWFGTVRGRGGVAFNNILVFGTAGVAFGEGQIQNQYNGLTESTAHVGWTAGLGLEVGLAPHWTAKAEYLYVDLSDQHYFLTGTSNGFQSNIFRLGVNYRF